MGWGGRFNTEGTYVYLWLIDIGIWQKTTKFCKAIILQLKNKFLKSGYKKKRQLVQLPAQIAQALFIEATTALQSVVGMFYCSSKGIF